MDNGAGSPNGLREADILSHALGQPYQITEALREYDCDILEGKSDPESWQLHPAIAFPDLIVEILANAWFPHSDFKLSCGSQDKIPQQLDTLALVVEAPVVQFKDPDKTRLRQAIAPVG